MQYGSRQLKHGDKGEDVEELQIRLSGFLGGYPDGDFGNGTESQVSQFQEDYMRVKPNGIVDRDTFIAIDELAEQYPINFDALKCFCGFDPQFKNWLGTCNGFGNGNYLNQYMEGKPKIEAYHMYEYPGIHRMLLWSYRAIQFYYPDHKFTINCGYRCWERNRQKGRFSTNHMGKAIDIDIPGTVNETKDEDMAHCNEIRDLVVNKCGGQIGWGVPNKKALEPSDVAPTWVHLDVRNYDKKYLADRFFCKDLKSLNNIQPIQITG